MREEKEKRNHKLTRHDKDGALQGSLVAWSRRVSSVDQRWLCCTHGVPLQLQRWDPILYNPFLKKPQTFTFKKNPSVYKKMYYFELFPPPCVRPALCVYEGRHYSLGETWMDNACMQCTCLHPVGVGCCETWVHKQTVWFGVQMPTVSKPHGLKRLSDFVFMVEQQFHQMFCLRIKKVATNVVSLQESCLCGFFLLILF